MQRAGAEEEKGVHVTWLIERFRAKRQHFHWILGLYITGKVMPPKS